MKKKIFLFFLIAIIGIAFMTVGAYKAQAQQPIKLTYSNFSHQPTSRANWPRPGVRRLRNGPRVR